MFYRAQRAQIAIVCLASMAFSPLFAREGGGFRGGGGGAGGAAGGRRPAGPAAAGSTPHSSPAPSGGTHPVGGSGPHDIGLHPGGGVEHHVGGIHGAEPMHGGGIGGNHFGGVGHGGPGGHFAGNIHQPGPHWNNYHQAFIGGHPVHLAWGGYRPSYYYHPWYHGPWGGHAWGWGWGFGPGLTFGLAGVGVGIGVGTGWGYPVYANPYGYWGRPLGWGFGGWGLGTTVYASGYSPYYNPYYYAPVGYPVVGYNYSMPIQVAVQAPPGAPTGGYSSSPPPSTVYDGSSPVSTSPQSAQPLSAPPLDNPAFDMARESFKRGDYAAALKDVDAAIRKTSTDAVMHEFRSLTLFAMRDYRQSAAVAHSVLAVGPGWDYTTMTSLYSDPFVYTEQLQRLEEYAREHPRAADAHFLLAYHDMIGSRKEAAVAELQQVVRLIPNDRLANELLMMAKGPKQSNSNPIPNPPPEFSPQDSLPGDPNTAPSSSPVADSSATPPPVDKALLPGTWNASRDDGSKFRLKLTADGRFSWQFSGPNQKGDEFSGTYTVDGPVLVLERKEGGALAGTALFSGDDQLNFKLVGGPPEDKGLDFGRM